MGITFWTTLYYETGSVQLNYVLTTEQLHNHDAAHKKCY